MKSRAWILAGAIAIPAAALAPTHEPRAEAQEKQPAPQQAPQQAPATPPSQPGAAEPPSAQQEAQAAEAVKQLVVKLREKGDNYQLKGTIAKVAPDGSAIFVERTEMPGVLLIMPPNVGVTEGGKNMAAQQLQPGDEIRATFNIAQQYPIALDIVRTGHEKAPATQPGATAPKK